ncbi:glycosyltransferase [Photorhabdus thracensis]|uniref:glycosyltransferase n=1 Tax=Photorhabdus thracensis TaxID=230089 RepID=UPI001E32FD65|nr:glycosyltransferase [Photorhabdus thracensis]MCC8422974.1 glycosyltransferase family 1 protein [Photorhabdus thracensis]
MIKVHGVVNRKFINSHAPDFQQLIQQCVDPDDIPERLYRKGRACWVFQTLITLNYYFRDKIECSVGSQCRSDAINLMHYDDFGSRVKPWKGLTVVCRADRPPVVGADYVIEQNKNVEKNGGIFISHWPQPGLKPRIANDNEIKTLGYFGHTDGLPEDFVTDDLRQRLAKLGVTLRISSNDWTDYRDIDVAISFRRKQHNVELESKPASKLINAWIAGCAFICDNEPAMQAVYENELDYLIAKNPDEFIDAVIRLKQHPNLYQLMIKNGKKRLEMFSREAVAIHWYHLFNDIWHKGQHKRSVFLKALNFFWIRKLQRWGITLKD